MPSIENRKPLEDTVIRLCFGNGIEIPEDPSKRARIVSAALRKLGRKRRRSYTVSLQEVAQKVSARIPRDGSNPDTFLQRKLGRVQRAVEIAEGRIVLRK